MIGNNSTGLNLDLLCLHGFLQVTSTATQWPSEPEEQNDIQMGIIIMRTLRKAV